MGSTVRAGGSPAAAKAEDARALAALLGVQYRRLENGEYAHNAVLTLLSPEGTVVATTDALEPPGGEFQDRLRSLLRATR